MLNFNSLHFNGTFRDYQQNVLNNSAKHIKDGKIHIVAAPGSGKTILGLELIRRIGKPALILAPSVTIRQQWGERFEGNFLPQNENPDDYVSYDLKSPKLLTSVTYQALHAAYNKTAIKEETDDDSEETEKREDFSDFELIKAIKASGITTICLDEAHHLRSEWQKALEGFIAALGKNITTIALTATPPYDSTPTEWKRYIDLCGEIDEEIFVPQLVAQKTLCPHQDYIYFSYPTEEETEIVKNYKERALNCTQEILESGILEEAFKNSDVITSYQDKEELILENSKGFIALFSLIKDKTELPKKLIKLLSPNGKLPNFNLDFAQTAFQFVIDTPQIFGEEESDKLKTILTKSSLMEQKKVSLISNDKLDKLLISSMGKLNSVNKIVQSESQSLGQSLRMLILTDYIKKDMLKIIGTNVQITSMGTVPIFESVRRICSKETNIAVLSGTLVIIPNSIVENITEIAKSKNVSCNIKPIENTGHSEAVFSGSNKNKVSIITEAFGEGLINVLIGTKSLLGEGWDSPCINSLILASFVGSFMLSNQMRGRAIRMDKNNPEKVSNIWHLVTIEPEYVFVKNPIISQLSKTFEDKDKINSDDFNTMERRFACFLAPAYHSNVIESGTERLDIIKPPYDKSGIENINNKMLALSKDRDTMSKRWQGALNGSKHPDIMEVDEVTSKVQPTGFLFQNIIGLVVLSIAYGTLIATLPRFFVPGKGNFLETLLSILLFILFGRFFIFGLRKVLHYLTPAKTIKTLSQCVLKTLKDIKEIDSTDAKVDVITDESGLRVYCSLSNATEHEKNVFSKAIAELLSSIDNPRYVLIKHSKILFFEKRSYTQSYACPTVIGTNKENVDVLAGYLKKSTGKFDLVFTRNEAGRKELLKCREYSLINTNESMVSNKKRATKWD